MTPLSLPAFWQTLRIVEMDLSLPTVAQVSRTAGGEVSVAALGARLWRASVTLAREQVVSSQRLQARLRQLGAAGTSALVAPIIGRTPQNDPQGTIAGATTTVSSVLADRTRLAIGGLPVGYRLAAGDYLSIRAANGTHHFHQLTVDGAADAVGATPLLGVVPAVSTAIAAGDAVTLVDPVFAAVIDPATLRDGTLTRRGLEGISFTIVQTLRA